ncbi:Stk1 family PASTA domain-containing Ser/Thr kinase [Yinghuangia seranimata]|uniref:Stk1 family PASTA domain-containing Ser/Thr kinase n=1 Tax=Yinghuangia seranimata TaxID=408067 RepID=UPI00248CDAFF|nr:Stk1 family PASTA domain-containing Ser/Thr kinase [Yinghuangia seranimata]MDI2126143.1 Stk1 family PASTA domain-containing Ser/Thr kinase [Yinghuangia seranimata]
MTMDDPLVGRLLDGRYRVESRIAAGGMATVYRALDTRLDRTVAVKVMHPAMAADASFTDRFIREAKAAARLSHPNVVGVFDQGHDGDVVFLAMEYVEGRTLRELLQDLGTLTPREAFGVLEPTLAALGAAHRAGFVHRDVKPENVLISDDGGIKVADFGLARATATAASAATGKVLVGTVAYLAPEQIERGAASPTSDVYAAGILLYEMLTGRQPYQGRSAVEIIYKHVHEDVPPPSRAVPGLSRALDTLIARSTARDPFHRPPDAEQLLAMVRQIRQHEMTDAELDFGAAERVLPPPPRHDDTPLEGELFLPTREVEVPLNIGPLGLPTESVLDEHLHAGYNDDGGAYDDHGYYDGPGEPPGKGAARRRGPSRGMLAFLVVVVLAAAIGITAWQLGANRSVSVPTVVSLARAEAQKKVESKGLKVRFQEEYSETVPRDGVISSDPGAGRSLDKGATVTLKISLGPERRTVPPLAGLPVDQARKAVTDAGLVVGKVSQQDSSLPVGQVASTTPTVGTSVSPGSTVDLIVSKGTPVPVPSLVGLTEQEARDTLAQWQLGVNVDPVPVFSNDAPAGRVASQNPATGTVYPGTVITVVMSKGPDLVLVPKVDGMSEDDAKRTLTDAGFQVSVNTVFPLGPKKVTSMSPGGNNMAPRGSKVTINVF